MDKDELIRKERQARREFPETKAAFDAFRKELLAAWHKSDAMAVEERESVFRYIRALDVVEAKISEAMNSGSEDLEKYAQQFATTDK